MLEYFKMNPHILLIVILVALPFYVVISLKVMGVFEKVGILQPKYRKLGQFDELKIREYLELLDSREFELFIARVYRKLGYKAEVTKESSDGGKDIVLVDENKETIFVECKRYNINASSGIGRPDVQKFMGACVENGVYKGIYINTGKYHNNALVSVQNANSKGMVNIELLDNDDVVRLCMKIDSSEVLKWLGCGRKDWEGSGEENVGQVE